MWPHGPNVVHHCGEHDYTDDYTGPAVMQPTTSKPKQSETLKGKAVYEIIVVITF